MTDAPARGSPVPAGSARRVPLVLLCGVYLVALGGRFTLDRVGMPELEGVDLRLLGGSAVGLGVLFWWLHPDRRERHVLPSSVRWALLLFAVLALSAAWSPPRARVTELLLDLAVLAALVVTTAALTAPDPERGARVLLALLLASGVLYAALGLVTGQTDVQGRAAVLGGGPNVYVRVVCLGILAAIAVAVLRRRWWPLALVPVLGAAAVLSGSRGGIAAAMVAALFFLVVFRDRWRAAWVGRVLVVCLLGALAGALTIGERIGAVVQDRVVGELAGASDFSERPALLAQAWHLVLEHPLLGGGLDAFWARYGRSVDLEYPHNLIAEVAVTAGLVGVGVLAVFLVRLVADARSCTPLSTARIALLVAAVYVLAGSMVSGDLYDTRLFWILAAAAVNPPSRDATDSPVAAARNGRPTPRPGAASR